MNPFVQMYRAKPARRTILSNLMPYPSRFFNPVLDLRSGDYRIWIMYCSMFWIIFFNPSLSSVLIQPRPYNSDGALTDSEGSIFSGVEEWRWTPVLPIRNLLFGQYGLFLIYLLYVLYATQTKWGVFYYTGVRQNPLTIAARAEMMSLDPECSQLPELNSVLFLRNEVVMQRLKNVKLELGYWEGGEYGLRRVVGGPIEEEKVKEKQTTKKAQPPKAGRKGSEKDKPPPGKPPSQVS